MESFGRICRAVLKEDGAQYRWASAGQNPWRGSAFGSNLERERINSEQSFRQNTAPAITFRQQAEWWIASLRARKRRPVKPATISGWQDALNAWLLPHLGDKLLADVLTRRYASLSRRCQRRGFPAKPSSTTCRWLNWSSPQQWTKRANKPTAQLESRLIQTPGREKGQTAQAYSYRGRSNGNPIERQEAQVCHAVRTVAGYRIANRRGALRCAQPISVRIAVCSTCVVACGVSRSRSQKRRTLSAWWTFLRSLQANFEVTFPASAAISLQTAQGKPLLQRKRPARPPQPQACGLPRFRRFRLTWLRKNGAPKDLERVWMGHASEEVGDLYSKLKEDVRSGRNGPNASG